MQQENTKCLRRKGSAEARYHCTAGLGPACKQQSNGAEWNKFKHLENYTSSSRLFFFFFLNSKISTTSISPPPTSHAVTAYLEPRREKLGAAPVKGVGGGSWRLLFKYRPGLSNPSLSLLSQTITSEASLRNTLAHEHSLKTNPPNKRTPRAHLLDN